MQRPRVIECVFCGETNLNDSHGSCVKEFGDEVLRKVIDHAAKAPGKPLPQKLIGQLMSSRGNELHTYLDRTVEAKKIRAQAERLSVRLESFVLLAARTKLKKLARGSDDFEVHVEVVCTPKPRS